MILTRRRFLQAAAGTLFVAPAIVKAENIMKIWVPAKAIEPLPYTGHFRVPDLRGHFATNPVPSPGPEMTATEVLQRRAEIKATWANRWGGHLNEKMSRKLIQDSAMRSVNKKIDNEIMDKLQGQEVTGVWIDEAQNIDMRYLIEPKTGEIQAAARNVTGWIPCDGRELSAIEYPQLFDALGNKYG